MKKIFSFDAETNGLWGQAFSIAAVVKNGSEVKTFIGRCPIEEVINPWVSENVLPEMKEIEENFSSYEEMLKAFSKFYLENKQDADVIAHVAFPVEAKVLLDMHKLGFIGDWDAPYPLIDISAFPEIGTSVDGYNKENNVTNPFKGSSHNPLYDSWAALVAYEHIMK